MQLCKSLFPAPDTPDFLGRYSMTVGTDYAQQTLTVNAIDDQVISEGMKTVCYNHTIYDDTLVEGFEYIGLMLSVSRATTLTLVQPMYDQAAILIQDNDG